MPAGNAIVVNDSASFPALHFALDYSLPAKSAFAGAGADVAAVYAAITGVVAGNGPLPPVIAPPVIVAPTLPPLVVVPVAPSDARAALKVIDAFLAYLRAQAALP
jgi:sorbitol-specific phosphotransferase system component IIBC